MIYKLKNSATNGSKKCEQMCSLKVWENLQVSNRADGKHFSPEGSSKSEGGDSCFRCEASKAQGTQRIKATWYYQNITIIFQKPIPKTWRSVIYPIKNLKLYVLYNIYIYCIYVDQSLSLTLCDAMSCTLPGFSVLHYLPKFAQTHIHWLSDAIQPCHPLLFPSYPALNLSQHQGLFQWVGSSHQVAKVLALQLQH